MRRMQRSMVMGMGILTLLLLATSVHAGGAGWLTDYEKAAAQAKKEGKLILVDFNGSDWCPPCIGLRKQVFDTDTFKTWAKENVILLDIDFPRRTPQAAAQKKHNQTLAKKYEIRGFPTVLFLTPQGRIVARHGFAQGGPAAWIKKIDAKVKAYKKDPASVKGELSAADLAKMPTFAETLSDGLRKAKVLEVPFLVVVARTEAQAKAYQAGLMKAKSFTGLTRALVSAAYVNLADTSDASKTRQKEFKALTRRAKLDATKTFYLIQPNGGKVLLASDDAKTLADSVMKAMPKPAAGDFGVWTESYGKALRLAKQTNRPVLIDFTGSDWCHWCIKLDKEVFEKPEFVAYAKESLVLLKLDFPRRKIPALIKAQNDSLKRAFGVRGYPTLFLIDASGQKLGRLGYQKGGPVPYVALIKGMVAKKTPPAK